MKWIVNNCLKLDGVIVECKIPSEAKIIVPKNSDGKFRTDIIQFDKISKVEDLFPMLKNLSSRLKKYKPVNPIIAEKMPPKNKIKNILDQVWSQVWNQVGVS